MTPAQHPPNDIGIIRKPSVALFPVSAKSDGSFHAKEGASIMSWNTPVIEEICVGMEVTSYESADLDVLF